MARRTNYGYEKRQKELAKKKKKEEKRLRRLERSKAKAEEGADLSPEEQPLEDQAPEDIASDGSEEI